MKKKIIFVSILMLALGIVIAAWHLSSPFSIITTPAERPLRQSQILGTKTISIDALLNPPDPEPIDINKLREMLHAAISHKSGAHLSAFSDLEILGNKHSVPLLIRALKWYPEEKEGDKYYVEDTAVFCVDALRSLTGENFKYDQKKWQRWWNEIGKKLSPDHFYPRAHQGFKIDDSYLRQAAWWLGLMEN